MRKRVFAFTVFTVFIAGAAFGRGFLSAQSFPETFQDLSFADRIVVLQDGYEDYESEYDANGVCISGCAYAGITIEQDNILTQKETAASLVQAALYEAQQKQPTQPILSNKPTQSGQQTKPNGDGAYYCQNQRMDIPLHQAIPRGEPVANRPRISSPYGNRTHPVTGKPQLHKGIDYAVPSLTLVYTTADGIVEKTWTDNSGCGNGLLIKHATGIRTQYCHLDHVTVKNGEHVFAGCPVAMSDNTGQSTGPHLHYGMKNESGNYLDPSAYTGRAN